MVTFKKRQNLLGSQSLIHFVWKPYFNLFWLLEVSCFRLSSCVVLIWIYLNPLSQLFSPSHPHPLCSLSCFGNQDSNLTAGSRSERWWIHSPPIGWLPGQLLERHKFIWNSGVPCSSCSTACDFLYLDLSWAGKEAYSIQVKFYDGQVLYAQVLEGSPYWRFPIISLSSSWGEQKRKGQGPER